MFKVFIYIKKEHFHPDLIRGKLDFKIIGFMIYSSVNWLHARMRVSVKTEENPINKPILNLKDE